MFRDKPSIQPLVWGVTIKWPENWHYTSIYIIIYIYPYSISFVYSSIPRVPPFSDRVCGAICFHDGWYQIVCWCLSPNFFGSYPHVSPHFCVQTQVPSSNFTSKMSISWQVRCGRHACGIWRATTPATPTAATTTTATATTAIWRQYWQGMQVSHQWSRITVSICYQERCISIWSTYVNWLVVSNILYVPSYIGNNHPIDFHIIQDG